MTHEDQEIYRAMLARWVRQDGVSSPHICIYEGVAHAVHPIERLVGERSQLVLHGWYPVCEPAGIEAMRLVDRPYITKIPLDAPTAGVVTCVLCLAREGSDSA